MRPWLVLALPVFALVGCARKAPVLEGGAVNGSSPEQRFAKLVEGKKTFLYFVKWDCSATSKALPGVKKLLTAYSDKVNIVGVIHAAPTEFQTWNKAHKIPIEFVVDPKLELIRRYSVQNSQTFLILDADGKELKRVDGYDRGSLNTVADEMAKEAGRRSVVSPDDVDESHASGEPFPL